MSDKTTVIMHIFNEEYLLPFWLNHHKDLFDDGIIIDYRSTDRSIEICKDICPEWTILTSKNLDFNSYNIDREVMYIESNVEGIKMVLNITEFVIFEKPLKEIFKEHLTQPVAFGIQTTTPYSNLEYNPENTTDLFKYLLNHDITFHRDRSNRYVHNYKDGFYHLGRHGTYHHSTITTDAHLVWFGYYPLNEQLLTRKLQIKQNIPYSDIEQKLGFQHLFDKEKMLEINKEKTSTGIRLQELSPGLYRYLSEKYS